MKDCINQPVSWALHHTNSSSSLDVFHMQWCLFTIVYWQCQQSLCSVFYFYINKTKTYLISERKGVCRHIFIILVYQLISFCFNQVFSNQLSQSNISHYSCTNFHQFQDVRYHSMVLRRRFLCSSIEVKYVVIFQNEVLSHGSSPRLSFDMAW